MARPNKNIVLGCSLAGGLAGGLLLGLSVRGQLVGIVAFAQGNAAYRAGAYGDAEINFRQALGTAAGGSSRYNLGNALYQQGRYAEAAQHYRMALRADAPAGQTEDWANLGQAYYQAGNWAGSLAAYRNALVSSPGDNRIRQDFLFVGQQMAARQKRQQPPRKTPAAPQDEKKAAEKKGAAEAPTTNASPEQGPPEQQLSDKNMAEIFGLINDNEAKARRLLSGTGPKARTPASDEKDY
ncbi:MAG: tetratricopeptide repeat protein [Janthinobacterium lividum]